MPKLTFYRQKRVDGGIRTGVELDGETILEEFEAGEGERDPALLWYVDLRCDGSGVPNDADEAARWLLLKAPVIEEGFSRFANQLRRVGADVDAYPLLWSEFPDPGEGVAMKIACSTTRLTDARGIAEILDDVRSHWSERIEAMIKECADLSPRD